MTETEPKESTDAGEAVEAVPAEVRALPNSMDLELASAMLYARAYTIRVETNTGTAPGLRRETSDALHRVARYIDTLARSARIGEQIRRQQHSRKTGMPDDDAAGMPDNDTAGSAD